uniref:Uncharacterized protein n=1 Tax=Arundo donax TaxID=35708 RepID=A0A0A9FRB6_ARUDO
MMLLFDDSGKHNNHEYGDYHLPHFLVAGTGPLFLTMSRMVAYI